LLVRKISTPEKEIILVGTAHVSRESIGLVRETIEKEKPDMVGVELCPKRLMQLRQGDKWGDTSIGDIISKGNVYLFLANLLLGNMQRKIGNSLGVKPGEEMLVAAQIAGEQKLPVALLDRDIGITLKRAIAKMGFIEKMKFFGSIFFGLFSEKERITVEEIERMKEQDVMTELIGKLSEEMPTIKTVLVDERDMYIANMLLFARAKKIVAVVGAGHLDGIVKYLDRRRDVREIVSVPKGRDIMKLVTYGVPAAFIALLAYAFVAKGAFASIGILMWWFLINGILSALGVLLAKGHPFSIMAAFIAAPFTSLHPLFAAGWFAGLVEAKVRNPVVRDFEGLKNLDSFGAFYKNRITRTLLVAAYANVGSTIGTVIALPYMLSLVL